ncbi:Nucleic-acid-binding protein from transposon X-element [Araneus ventricosus]|uniref:Nucleic-acid-binding protein from transposon X-element n=1 Tax=Araneus ventricosus TaxID=182803 RepID=A0A4Y2RN48_ARAVE|nr:Nucleic-acid-binding protein from transposon X-element [Araneus ventricosus]
MPLPVTIDDIENEVFNGISDLAYCDCLIILLSRFGKTDKTIQLMDTIRKIAMDISDGKWQFSQTTNDDSVSNQTNQNSLDEVLTPNINQMMDIEQTREEVVVEIHERPNEEKMNKTNEKQLNNSKISNNPAIYTGPQIIQNANGNLDDGFQFQRQRQKHKRNLSGTIPTAKKPNMDNPPTIELKNKYNGLQNQIERLTNPNIPPVVMKRTENYKLILNRIIDVQKIKCRVKPTGEFFFYMYCETEKDHRSLTEYLDSESLEYYVIASLAEKPTKVVIHGLDIDSSSDDIREELTMKNYRVDKVHQFKKFRTKKPIPVFQVHLLPTENLKEIYEIDTLLHMIVTIEPYQRKSIGQCFHCQAFSHVASKCKMIVKCVICAEQHDSRNCPPKNIENPTKKCANCGGPHTASYRGCPKFPKIKNNEVRKEFSYAAAAKTAIIQNNPQPTARHTAPTHNPQSTALPNFAQLKDDFSDVFRLLNHLKAITQAIPNIKNLLNKLDNETSIENKIFLIAEVFNQTSFPSTK